MKSPKRLRKSGNPVQENKEKEKEKQPKDELDDELLKQISELETSIRSSCSLIPVSVWDFDETIKERLKEHKHELVNKLLNKAERRQLPSARKQRLARALDGGVLTTVTQIIDHFATTPGSVNVNVKVPENAPKPLIKNPKPPKQEEVVEQQKVAAGDAESSDETGSSSEDVSDTEEPKKLFVNAHQKSTQKQPEEKSMQKEGSADEQSEGEEDNEDIEMTSENDDGDSTDEEVEMKSDKQKGNKRKQAQTEKMVENGPKPKKTKLDLELEKYVGVDETSLDPIESRHLAMLKLQKKIENMKTSRKGQNKSKTISGKRAAELEKERKLKRRMSKLKMKQKKAEARIERKQESSESQESKPNGNNLLAPPTVKVEQAGGGASLQLPLTEDGKIAYSKFDFIVKDKQRGKKKRATRAEKADKFTGKDYKSLLHKVEKRKEKLESLQEKDPEKAAVVEEDIKWNRAMKRASGMKVKDDENLLKKGLKRKEKEKAKRKEKWAHRVEKVEKDIAERQDKRRENIRKRVEEKKKRKLTKLRKKGRLL